MNSTAGILYNVERIKANLQIRFLLKFHQGWILNMITKFPTKFHSSFFEGILSLSISQNILAKYFSMM